MYARGIVPGERVCPCKNTRYAYGYNTRLPTRNFCEFCNTCIPVPGTSVSCVRLSYPYPEYTKPNRTQSTAVIVCFFFLLLAAVSSEIDSYLVYELGKGHDSSSSSSRSNLYTSKYSTSIYCTRITGHHRVVHIKCVRPELWLRAHTWG